MNCNGNVRKNPRFQDFFDSLAQLVRYEQGFSLQGLSRGGAPLRLGRASGGRTQTSELEVAVDQIVLLEAPEALADLPGAHGADAVDGLELPLARADDGVE